MIAILELVCARIMVSLINKYLLSGSCSGWMQQSCSADQIKVDEHEMAEEDEGEAVSSTNTTISDSDVRVHCH